ncbi:MAG: aminomethyl-transferring glycine dehydrogenase subunit GcvPA [Clostridia bacterium]|nr:aminomethyl-transferring glycine dehydrogenase subunit GcvPA [Clostridia bacterium]
MGRYVVSTKEEQLEMLRAIGLDSLDDLYADVPDEAKASEFNVPEGMSELEVREKLEEMADRNVRFRKVFRGAGAYRHYIPAIVKSIVTKEEFVTAYTPYQAEISQGVLQSIFEYQTQMCELTGMDASNASIYDGATAAAEAVMMCIDRKRNKVLVSEALNPETIEVVKTYCESRDVEVVTVPLKEGKTDIEALKERLDSETAAVITQSPNFYGLIEDIASSVEVAHDSGAKYIMSVNPIALGILRTPGEYGCDICVAEGQPLGMPMGFGGPYLGIMTCKAAMTRKLPGRIVGETTDHEGRRAFVLTLQAREQHIRREKASSNVCSNEALCAMTASVYLAAMGPDGLKQVAESCVAHAHYLRDRLLELGFRQRYDGEFFHEFLVESPADPKAIEKALADKGILSGLEVDGGILFCATELTGKKDIDELIETVKEVISK